MKIGILTFYTADNNYGQLLQGYAMQRYLQAAGHTAFLIRYDATQEESRSLWRRILIAMDPVLAVRHLRKKLSPPPESPRKIETARRFDEFRETYFTFSLRKYPRLSELRKNPPEADAYIVGSDQVWNFTWGNDDIKLRFLRNYIHAYMLDFGKRDTLRLSYAASWGATHLPAGYAKEIQPLLARFSYVSVRERDGIDLCAACGRNDAAWVPDPTMLLDPEAYRSLYRKEHIQTPSRPYLFVYILSDKTPLSNTAIYRWAKEHQLGVVDVMGYGEELGHEKAYLTIPEWLAYLDGATAVFTDSFHGSVFATLFQRPFGVMKIIGLGAGMNTRLDSLFERCHTEPRYIQSEDDLVWLERPVKALPDIDKTEFSRILSELEKGRRA